MTSVNAEQPGSGPEPEIPEPQQPRLQEPPPSPPLEPGLAPWGPWGAIIGLLAQVSVMLLAAIVIAGAIRVLGMDQKGVAFRLTAVLVGSATFLVVPFWAVRTLRLPWSSLGFHRPTRRALGEAVLFGVGLWLLLFFLTELCRWWLPEFHQKLLLEESEQFKMLDFPAPLLLFIGMVVAPVTEEIFFRAFFFAGLRRRFNFAVASVVSAFLFALAHQMLYSMIPLALVGLCLATVYERQRSVWAAILTHAVFNGTTLVAALFVSGAP